jgi:SOS-response transcriptional repressor LexA
MTMKMGLTKKQRELLDYIEAYHQERGFSPSYQQMMEQLGLHSKSGIHRLVHALAERGHIKLPQHRRARAIAPLPATGTHTISLTADLDDKLRLVASSCGRTPEDLIVRILVDVLYPPVQAAA